ncbi:MAG TPA: benzoyl-CoA reductase subunit B [Pseudomonadota bacterium]|nr:benzoyl-CoA reductase subunit B [Pseudomonadota bacterium]HND09210.1 benzoyl-CoA reductase subunit B [Pseudomonadota bacterium]HNN51448.1 benzoyl-CoA reductase subunit B [Pseudomonadota bacterium]
MSQDQSKDQSMVKQKEMIANHFAKLSTAKESGRKVVYTFVPGNLTELLHSFDLLAVYPEINALQSGMRRKSGAYVTEAEKFGHSEDVCAYVKSDIGMLKAGNIGPTGERLPPPDLLLLSYTGCFTFMKWFELLKREYDCPVVMLHVPYQGDGTLTPDMRKYVVDQIRRDLIPVLEKISGKSYDEDKVKEHLRRSAQSEDDLVWVLESAKHKPSPIDGYFGGVYYIGPIFTAFRGTQDAIDYYRMLRQEVTERIASGQGPITPDGPMGPEKYRLVVEGPPNWTHFHEFWKMFYDEGAVVVASSYTKVGGTYDLGFRHDPDHPLESLAEYCGGCYTNLNLPSRIDLLCKYMTEYQADGLLINSVKSCNSFSAGQLMMMREVERRTGKPTGFVETDLVDPRYFSAANIKNRLESYLQMIEQKRRGALPDKRLADRGDGVLHLEVLP